MEVAGGAGLPATGPGTDGESTARSRLGGRFLTDPDSVRWPEPRRFEEHLQNGDLLGRRTESGPVRNRPRSLDRAVERPSGHRPTGHLRLAHDTFVWLTRLCSVG